MIPDFILDSARRVAQGNPGEVYLIAQHGECFHVRSARLSITSDMRALAYVRAGDGQIEMSPYPLEDLRQPRNVNRPPRIDWDRLYRTVGWILFVGSALAAGTALHFWFERIGWRLW